MRNKYLRFQIKKYSYEDFKKKYKKVSFPKTVKFVLEGETEWDEITGEVIKENVKEKKLGSYNDFCVFVDNLKDKEVDNFWFEKSGLFQVHKKFITFTPTIKTGGIRRR